MNKSRLNRPATQADMEAAHAALRRGTGKEYAGPGLLAEGAQRAMGSSSWPMRPYGPATAKAIKALARFTGVELGSQSPTRPYGPVTGRLLKAAAKFIHLEGDAKGKESFL